jgi:SAM-dependent methyltransferase
MSEISVQGSTVMRADTGLRLPADEVVASLYRAILNREPDPGGLASHTRRLEEGGCLDDIVRAFVASPEARSKEGVSLGPLDRAPPNPIQFDLSAEQRETLWQHVSRVWSRLGQDDPYFSVLTANDFRVANLSAATVERFYDSGEGDIQRAEQYLARHGLQLPRDGCCLDYGCGLGRTTLWLARRCKRVVAVDVSEAHLNIARQALAARGVGNVEFRLLRRPCDLSMLRGIDFFHSIIVLQHNPPPIIADILEQAFAGLNKGGSAFFQVPTYGMNYAWNFEQYMTERLPHSDIEMHMVPQELVFAAASRAGCLPLEVQPDACIGERDWISNTFLFVKPDRWDRGAGRGGRAGALLRRLLGSSLRRRPSAA